MLEPILGSLNAERVLIYLLARDEGYTREIARFYSTDPDSIQKQLVRLEAGSILVGKSVGRTRIYSFNPRYSFLKELKALLSSALSFYPQDDQDRLMLVRKRPRRTGKPL